MKKNKTLNDLEEQKKEPDTLWDAFENISALVQISRFSQNNVYLVNHSLVKVRQFFDLNDMEILMLAYFLSHASLSTITLQEMAQNLNSSNIEILKQMPTIESLIKKGLIFEIKEDRWHRGGICKMYTVNSYVVDIIKKEERFDISKNLEEEISCTEDFLSYMDSLFYDRKNQKFPEFLFLRKIEHLLRKNQNLSFAKDLLAYNMDTEPNIVFLAFCIESFFNAEEEHRIASLLADIFDSSGQLRNIEKNIVRGTHQLIEKDLIEPSGGKHMFIPGRHYCLTQKAKDQFLKDLKGFKRQNKKPQDLLEAKNIAAKELFYNLTEQKQIQELTSLLSDENFRNIQERLEMKKMRRGFCCLFFGSPGTGKTETVYQIARLTGRDIMLVNISDMKNMYWGESEKRVKALFDRYRRVSKSQEIAPILLFNEADAVIGKREKVGHNASIDQTQNAMQNIILQEIEDLEGIMIATTNLTANMDKAFERRFLYKVEFKKPNLIARQKIWESIMPDISSKDAQILAEQYDFSGGQIENIARRYSVSEILSGGKPSIDEILEFCLEEKMGMDENQGSRIGFMGKD